MTPSILLFISTYILILFFGKYRTYIALTSGVLFVLTGMLPYSELFSSIDFNVLLMIIGTMGLVSLFTESKMPAMLADMVMEKVPDVKWAAVSLALFAGIISAGSREFIYQRYEKKNICGKIRHSRGIKQYN
ncbi:MAG: hypothetical protein IJO74_00780 [Clostridia bacterium]|nr:hypothetical protein [Clostridia bacterium]